VSKYIQLFEEYTEIKEKGLEKLESWTDVRDRLNLKLPFMIIDFKDNESLEFAINSQLSKERYANQTYYVKDVSNKILEYPSIFIFCEGNELDNSIKGLQSRFNIHRIISGKYGKNTPVLYTKGSSVEFGSDIKSGLSIDDVNDDDYYKIGSTYYKFIN